MKDADICELVRENSVETKVILFKGNHSLQAFCGSLDGNLKTLAEEFGISFSREGVAIKISGPASSLKKALPLITRLKNSADQGDVFDPVELVGLSRSPAGEVHDLVLPRKTVRPRNENQKHWVDAMRNNELAFGHGPAGTGKTMLAVAVGTSMLIEGAVDRIIISRPAVEAGERLGFLPGDMKEKVDPYMQPIYDALNEFLPSKQVQKMLAERKIEIAPLAFMRGRTLSNAFILLDEAQNTTTMQMKMFLTRLGPGSRMAITGDPKQVDLPKGVESGLVQALRILQDVKEIARIGFTAADVVRHPLVGRIVQAYETVEKPQ